MKRTIPYVFFTKEYRVLVVLTGMHLNLLGSHLDDSLEMHTATEKHGHCISS